MKPHPNDGTGTTPARGGDVALLVAILIVGALPFVGWVLRYDVAPWELGVGTAVILCGGAELVRELFWRRSGDRSPR